MALSCDTVCEYMAFCIMEEKYIYLVQFLLGIGHTRPCQCRFSLDEQKAPSYILGMFKLADLALGM